MASTLKVDVVQGNSANPQVNDTNGNELIKTSGTTSAVNEFTITNAATGGIPVLSATGGDTNIGLQVSPKGTGKITITDGTDTTKKVNFDCSGVTTATTRTKTLQDNAGTIYESGGTDVTVADGGTGSSTAATARTALGLAIGTDVQAYDATLLSIATLGTAADKIAYTTEVDTWAETSISASGRAIINTTISAAGDLLYGTGVATLTRLAVGAAKTKLAVNSGATAPEWVADTQNTVVDAAGDLLYGSGADVLTRLAIGTAKQKLVVNSGATAPSWVTPGISMNVYTANDTVAAPADSTHGLTLVWGGGGGSGGANANIAGAGGGGGGFGMQFFTAAQLDGAAVTVGAGGAAGTSAPGAGGNGGTTSVGALISATGGTGSAAATGGVSGGAGGTSAATFNVSGGLGGQNNYVNIGSTYGAGQGGSSFGVGGMVGNQGAGVAPGAGATGTLGSGAATAGYAGGAGRVMILWF